MGARIKADGYQVEVIENHPDILKAIEDVLKKFAVNSVTHVQVLYAGHGEHKTKSRLGTHMLEESERERVVALKEILGDVIVSVKGEQISIDELIWEILEGKGREEALEGDASGDGRQLRAVKDDARICIILDCCREESFRGGRQAQPTAVKNKDGYQLKMDIEELNFNNQIITIQTSLLGFWAKDHYSFTHRLLRETK